MHLHTARHFNYPPPPAPTPLNIHHISLIEFNENPIQPQQSRHISDIPKPTNCRTNRWRFRCVCVNRIEYDCYQTMLKHAPQMHIREYDVYDMFTPLSNIFFKQFCRLLHTWWWI